MGPPDGTPRHKVESIASGTRSLCHTLGTRATQVRAPGPGENGPLPSLKNISDCKRRPAEIGVAAIPLIRKRPKGDMYPDAMLPGCRQSSQRIIVNRPNGSSSIVPTQQVDDRI